MSVRKPFNDKAGYIASLRHPVHRGWIVIYRAEEQGLDTEGGPWAVVCESHKRILSTRSLKAARAAMKAPDFCEECEVHAAVIEAKRFVRRTPKEEIDRLLFKTSGRPKKEKGDEKG